jgi:hypothetical protein
MRTTVMHLQLNWNRLKKWKFVYLLFEMGVWTFVSYFILEFEFFEKRLKWVMLMVKWKASKMDPFSWKNNVRFRSFKIFIIYWQFTPKFKGHYKPASLTFDSK